MAIVESTPITIGSTMPNFELKSPDGETFNNQKLIGENGLIIVFTCNHCPYAQAIWERVISIADQAEKLGIKTVAINPNIHQDYPEDSPEEMKKLIQKLEIKFPYLVDEIQQTAKEYKAQCTPDIYLLDNDGKLVYHGRVDDNWQDKHSVTSHELLAAVNALANGLEINKEQKPSLGCSIKWR